jgi:hypothetical protein
LSLLKAKAFSTRTESSVVMTGLVARKSGLPDLRHFYMTDLGGAYASTPYFIAKAWMPATIGERSDAVLWTAMRGHDVERLAQTNWKPL